MHYYIDGYNMLFRVMSRQGLNLRSQRENIIYELDKKITLIKLDVSLVFDATFQIGERSRSHFHSLEILFTAAGETADDFILDELKNSLNPEHETVVTSDKDLAWRARLRSAHTQSVEDFLIWLNKCYKNKLKSSSSTPKIKSPLPFSKKTEIPSSTPSPTFTKFGTETPINYEQIFEEKFQELSKQEAEQKKPVKKQPKPVPRRAKKKRFLEERPSAPKAATEMERWLKAFEDMLQDNEEH